MGCKHHPQHEQDGIKNIRIRKQRNTIRLCLETGRIGQGNRY